MTSAVGKLLDRVPPLTALPLPRSVDRRWLASQGPVSELAPAPEGLKPILGDPGAPVIGHSLSFMRFGQEFGLHRFAEFGPVSWMGAFGNRIITVSGADATQAVLTNKDKAFSQEAWQFFIGKFFPRGLMLLDFAEHHMHRRIMQQAFTRDRLTGYVAQMGPTVRDGVQALAADPHPRLYRALKQLTLDIASRVFMDMPSGRDADAINRAFVDAVRAGTAIVRRPVPGGRWAAGLRGRRTLEAYFGRNLPAKREHDGADLFSALCHASTEDGERYTDEDVINQMIFLMMAAHDTSTITSTTAAYYLAKYPQWQQKAREESLRLGDGIPDIEALESLQTLELVIKESLRLVPPVPTMARQTVKDTELLGFHLPKGMMVSVSPTANHFDPALWSDPHEFDPERFAEPRREDKAHRFAWMPFGGGAHKCIGLHFGMLEVKALLHEMLLNYEWHVPTAYTARWDYVSLPVPVDGLPVHLVKR
ncbi:cytochrome P450 [Amycolatopsis sp. cg5]|uniref:cytochrome P450 n=1 Tax=Amycolatopsis sp. cg5 TaxID=3238802 RepID=UPI0035244645